MCFFLLVPFLLLLINICFHNIYPLVMSLVALSLVHNFGVLHLLVLNIYMDNILILMCTFRLVSLFLALQIILYCLFLCSQNSILTYSYLMFFRIFLVVLLIVLCFCCLLCLLYILFCLYSSLFLFLIFWSHFLLFLFHTYLFTLLALLSLFYYIIF